MLRTIYIVTNNNSSNEMQILHTVLENSAYLNMQDKCLLIN